MFIRIDRFMEFIVNNCLKYKEYILYAAGARLKSEVSNSYLNWVWWILVPALEMIVYYVVFGLFIKIDEPYHPLFLYIGVTMWIFFSKCVTGSVDLVRQNRYIIVNIFIPKSVLLMKDILVNVFKMMLSFVIIAIMMVCYRIPLSLSMLYFVPLILILVIFTFGTCCIILHLGVLYEDMGYIVSILLNIAMFFSGIFYSIERLLPNIYGYILGNFNPVAFLVICMRKAMIYNGDVPVTGVVIWFVLSIVLSCCGVCLIKNNENNYVKLR